MQARRRVDKHNVNTYTGLESCSFLYIETMPQECFEISSLIIHEIMKLRSGNRDARVALNAKIRKGKIPKIQQISLCKKKKMYIPKEVPEAKLLTGTS